MRQGIFLQATLRQPMKTALLLILTGMITFAFVSRVSEYLLVKQETERLGEQYRVIGTLEALSDGEQVDFPGAKTYLEQSNYVGLVDQARYTSAVMEGVYNTDLIASTQARNNFLFGDIYLYGTLKYSSKMGAGGYRFYFEADSASMPVVYPEYPKQWEQFVSFSNSQDDFTGTTHFDDLTWLYDELEPGKRYLVRGQADLNGYYPKTFILKPLAEGGPWFIPLSEDEMPDFTDPSLEEVSAALQIEYDNMHALYAIAVKDMSAMPKFQQEFQFFHLTEGRLLDSLDDSEERKVCVINAQLAADRGLAVGDMLTLTLRDIETCWAYNGYLCTESDLARRENIETMTDDYEIVGLYGITGHYLPTALRQNIYIPSSAIPETFSYVAEESYAVVDGIPADPGGFGYVLSSPDKATEFLADAEGALERFGFRPILLDNGWEDFITVSRPMVRSSLTNAIIFSILLVVTVCMISFLYFKMRQKDIAIARALGLPVGRCGIEASVPLLLFGFVGILCGGAAGWQYAELTANETLQDLADFGSITAVLPTMWLAVLYGVALVLLLITTLGGVIASSRRPVLDLLQGGRAVKLYRPIVVADTDVPIQKQPSVLLISMRQNDLPVVQGKGSSNILHFVWRYIIRSKLKSALSVMLATGFTIGLATIHLSILSNQAKMDWLYNNTLVQADLVRNSSRSIKSKNFIRQSTIDALMDTGYISEAYLESTSSGTLMDPEDLADGTLHIAEGERLSVELLASNNLQTLLEQSDDKMTVTFHSGWNVDRFDGADWELPPVLLPRQIYSYYHVQEDDAIGVLYRGGNIFEVAGYYEINSTETPILLPLMEYQEIGG